MSIKVLKNENSYRIKELFDITAKRLSKESINKILSSNNLMNIYKLILDHKSSVRSTCILIADLLNLYAQIDLERATLLINQIGELDDVGIAWLQIDSELTLKHNCDCYIENCVLNKLSLRYTDLDSFLDSAHIRNSFIQTLKITFDASMSKQLVYGLDFEEEVWAQLKLLQSDANDVQIWFR